MQAYLRKANRKKQFTVRRSGFVEIINVGDVPWSFGHGESGEMGKERVGRGGDGLGAYGMELAVEIDEHIACRNMRIAKPNVITTPLPRDAVKSTS